MDTLSKNREYDAKVDSKKRITIREPQTDYYHVEEREDGTILLSPRVLVHPDSISERTLEMIDKSVKNFKSGNFSDIIDLDELKSLND
jgi:hypothetical protein